MDFSGLGRGMGEQGRERAVVFENKVGGIGVLIKFVLLKKHKVPVP